MNINKKIFKLLTKTSLSIVLVILSQSLYSETWTPKIKLINGTNAGIGKAETIKLIALQGGMVPIAEFKDKSGEFSLGEINSPDGAPVLIQVNYKNANYNKMVPPAPNFRTKVQEIIVYESKNDLNSLDVKSVVQILREKDRILVQKLFILLNESKPEMSIYAPEKIQFYIPDNAREVTGGLTQGSSKMNIPLTLAKGDKGRVFERAILPGQSEIQISYYLDAPNLSELNFLEKKDFSSETIRIFLLKPEEMILSSSNSKLTKLPEKGPDNSIAYRLELKDSMLHSLNLKGGSPVERETFVSNERKIENGNIFVSREKSLYGVIAVIAFLFSLNFMIRYKKN
ncbi:MAG: hypothetical protein SFU98_13440 [Leptospiraceae bacterium]|nr:hypothetical protein [Leptospiraceae bacterium]